MTGEMHPIPDGFSLMPPRGPFIAANGPFYHDSNLRFGFTPEERHCNLLGFAHGGIIATLLDSAMAHSVVTTHGYAIVTEQLNIEYASVVAKNRWAEVEVILAERENEQVHAKAVLRSRGQICAKSHANFKLLLKRPVLNGGRQSLS